MQLDAKRLRGYPKYYDWGDPDALYRLLNWERQSRPLAEVWFGTHPAGHTYTQDGQLLGSYLNINIESGNNSQLPYLMKYIAPATPLSIQVHPDLYVINESLIRRDSDSVANNCHEQLFQDANEKPEMLFALSNWQALVGMCDISNLRPFLRALHLPLGHQVEELLNSGQEKRLFKRIAQREAGFQAADIERLIKRSEELSESANATISEKARLVCHLNRYFPLDPGVLMGALMNIVHLKPRQVLFIPVGTIHAYISGIGIELMTASDNVFRAGLTRKRVDTNSFLASADLSPSKPQFIQPQIHEFDTYRRLIYRPPVPDFCMELYEYGGRDAPLSTDRDTVATCIEGEISVGRERLRRGETVFLPAGYSTICGGEGCLILARTQQEHSRVP
ncbi:MAG: mannose-6-phosphate isomerase, class I [Actinomycetaceae bacterium]|nr:mannose-6-phosphate isomerase, class I [Actinomycetaceae bacterium]